MAGWGRAPATSVTLGRENELGVLLPLLDVAGSGERAAALVSGEPGSGKTHLLHALARVAPEQGWVVLEAVGVEAETVQPGAALLSVLSPVREHVTALSAAQRDALTAALGWGSPTDRALDRFLVGA